MIIGIKKLTETAKFPTKAYPGDAGYDLYADSIDYSKPSLIKVHTGISIDLALREDLVGLIYARSGLSTKYGLRLANGVGVIDSNYQGEIIVALRKDLYTLTHDIKPSDRVAQLIIQHIPFVEFKEVYSNTKETARGERGFGSSERKIT